MTPAEAAAQLAFGAALRAYRFDKYRTTEKPEKKPSLAAITVATEVPDAARDAHRALGAAAEAIAFTRDLVSEPANTLYPETLAERAASLTEFGLSVEVLDENRMRELGMGALLGVAQGSVRPPRLVVMEHRGGPAGTAPIAFVGKGVTFDTGGISIKPAAGMGDMKWDMAGAGAVIGLMRLLGARKARVNAVGIVGLVENMPSGSAQRPGDIVRSMSGQTIEVLNTDAEGRLVLADALWYCQDRFKPQLMVDLATLTGAIIVALGNEYAGLFANNDELAERLIAVRQGGRRKAVADAARRQLRPRDRQRRRRRQEHRRRPRRRQHDRGAVHQALCQRRALGASRHRRRRLVEKGFRHCAEGRDRVRRPAARPLRRRALREGVIGRVRRWPRSASIIY